MDRQTNGHTHVVSAWWPAQECPSFLREARVDPWTTALFQRLLKDNSSPWAQQQSLMRRAGCYAWKEEGVSDNPHCSIILGLQKRDTAWNGHLDSSINQATRPSGSPCPKNSTLQTDLKPAHCSGFWVCRLRTTFMERFQLPGGQGCGVGPGLICRPGSLS